MAKSTADSEVTALAGSVIVGEYVKALLESMLIPIHCISVKCDNRAAIVLSSGEGSWKTKALANRAQGVNNAVHR